MLAYVFYFLGWAPAPLGRFNPVYSPPPTLTGLYLIDALLAGDLGLWWASLKQLILPVLTMALFVLAPMARMTRAVDLRCCRPTSCAPRARRASSWKVLRSYACHNALYRW